MRPKQVYRRFTRDEVLDIVRSYHLRRETQTSLAERHDTNTGYISRMVNGQAWPGVYEQVAREQAADERQGVEGGA